ncbi:hypothetical protein Aab01nite_00780 [Paractinoplanes abujensis]|uniref:Putative ABC transport system permease protein n=1 Tax=Paractinoplanes abujensis TaxID=882441 RepID=A0A7W7CP22_9ACTN|nr:hypothetical protein [Actinoplanes abujensis]MBB4692097.1 putative ABC transport system permease protein [Actinoplanes abujensis]GID16488.1 hypothetical protein Aab01nite_00780 [Actinoplanes abujensis]
MLVRAAFGALFRAGSWSVLVVLAFVVAGTACAAPAMFAEAGRNAAFQAGRDAVPGTARQEDAALVRLTGSRSPRSAGQQRLLTELRTIPHLSEPRFDGGSAGKELSWSSPWSSTVSAGSRREQARLYAVTDPATELVVTDGSGPAGGVWLPEPLGFRPGETVTVAVADKRATAMVTGLYAVVPGGRRPADRPGSQSWALRDRDLPFDSKSSSVKANLIIGDVPTVERLAEEVHDQILWAAEATLDEGATLAEAREAGRGVAQLRRRVAAQGFDGVQDTVEGQLASGIGAIAEQARAASETVRQRTRPIEWAAVTVALVTVLAMVLLSVRRRAVEVRHAVGSGVGPAAVGGLWLAEHLLPALLGSAAGWGVAWLLVTRAGPPGAVTSLSVLPALGSAGLGALAGLTIAAVVPALAAARLVRPLPPATPRRPVPWALPVLVVALFAGAGLAGSQSAGVRNVDLLVPLLVLAASGVLVGLLLTRLTGLRRSFRAGRLRGAGWLTRRRLADNSGERRLAVAVMTTGLGMLLFALCAMTAASTTVDDRVAVQAGAEFVAALDGGSAQLDPGAAEVPQEPTPYPVPGVRTPPLPPYATLVWRYDVSSDLDGTQRHLLVVDPVAFRALALWGRGPDLARARSALSLLEAPPDAGRIPAIAVADPAAAGQSRVSADTGSWKGTLDVGAHVAAFPGLDAKPTYVVSEKAFFAQLGAADPRLAPRDPNSATGAGAFVRTMIWSSRDIEAIDVDPERVTTAAAVRQRDIYVAANRARGYQVAVAAYLALLAVLALCVHAQRTAAARRASDLMLIRVGLGRGRALRARLLELALLAAAALAGAVAGVAALLPLGTRLLDDEPLRLPPLHFGLTVPALAITAAVTVAAVLPAAFFTTSRSAEEASYRDNG